MSCKQLPSTKVKTKPRLKLPSCPPFILDGCGTIQFFLYELSGFSRLWFKGPSGFSAKSTAEQVTDGIDGSALTAIVTGHFLLTNLLLETMKKTVKESNQQGRIVNVSSEGHRFAYRAGICFDKINDESWYNSICAYGQSKLANILHANELARRFKEEGVDIIANSLHPGSIATSILHHRTIIDGIIHSVGKYVLKSIPQGAATTCYVALHPQVKEITGEYFMDSNKARACPQAKDEELAKRLWDLSTNLTESK